MSFIHTEYKKSYIGAIPRTRLVFVSRCICTDMSSSSDDDEVQKPTFVPKSQRTIQPVYVEEIKIDHTRIKLEALANAALIDIQDEPEENVGAPPLGNEDTPTELAKWKIREMKRLLRDSDQIADKSQKPGVFFQ